MSIKLISMDLDGTLTESGHQVSERNKQALKAAQKQGVLVTISTGRMFRSAQKFAQQLAIDVPIITYNGAYIKTSGSGQVLLSQTVDAKLACEIIELAQERAFIPQAFIDDHLLVGHINHQVAAYAQRAGVPVRAVDDLIAYIKSSGQGLNKLLLIGQEEPLTDFWQEAQKLYQGCVNIVKSRPYYLDFIHVEAHKGHGLAVLAQQLDIKKEEILAIGDSYNDLGLFEAAGLKIAMGNAVDQLKKRADFITTDCEEDGLAVAIEKFVL